MILKINLILLILIILSLFLISCVTTIDRVNQEVGINQPLQYKEGYQSGCDSGYVSAGNPYYRFNKDVNRYSKDELYKQGWDDGYNICRGKYNSLR